MTTDRRALLASAIAFLAPAAGAAAIPATLLGRLRAGGLVLLMRHAQTTPGAGDPPGFALDRCETQRNLSAGGRLQAEAIGATLRQAGVPVARVLTSAWCRAKDTGTLLALAPIEPLPALDSIFGQGDRAAQTAELRRWIAAFAGPGNAVLVSHQVNVTALTDQVPAMGETLVLEPAQGAAGFRLLGRLSAADLGA